MIHESFKEDPVTSAGACPVLGADAFRIRSGQAGVPRRARGTDYAKAQGLFVNTRDDTAGLSEWWTRTPNSPSSSVNCVMADGCIQRSAAATWTEIGVRPACVFAELRDEVEDDECRWCGRTHGSSFFDRITSFFHAMLCRLFLA